MKKIPLTQGKFAIVDDEDFEWLSKYKWHASKSSNGKFYAKRAYRENNGDPQKRIYMHIMIMGQKGVDHANGNTLLNIRSNLRRASKSQNGANRPKSKIKCISSYKGVTVNNKKWRGQIVYKRKNFHLGYFSTEKEAALFYDAAALLSHGEFAFLNFPNLKDCLVSLLLKQGHTSLKHLKRNQMMILPFVQKLSRHC